MSTLNKKDKQLKEKSRSLSFVKDDDRTVVVLKIYQNEKNKEGLQFEKISPLKSKVQITFNNFPVSSYFYFN